MKNTKIIAPHVAEINKSGFTLPETLKSTSQHAQPATGVVNNSKCAARSTKKSRKAGEKNSEADLRFMAVRVVTNDAETLKKNKVVSPDPATMLFRYRNPKTKATYFFSSESRYLDFLENKQSEL